MPHPRRLMYLTALVIALAVGCQGKPEAPAPASQAPTQANAPTQPSAPPTAPPLATPGQPSPAKPGSGSPLGQSPTEITPSGKTRLVMVQGLQFDVPAEWEELPSTSPMRLSQMLIPGPGGKAEIALFRFPGGAGSVEQNIARWTGQFTTPAGTPPPVKQETSDLGGLSVTTVTIEGTYIAPISPRDPTNRFNEPNWIMVGVIVQGAGDAYFFKAVGPAATLNVWQPALAAFVKSFRVAA